MGVALITCELLRSWSPATAHRNCWSKKEVNRALGPPMLPRIVGRTIVALHEISSCILRRISMPVHLDGPEVPKSAGRGEVTPRIYERNTMAIDCEKWR
jgi:hypothetical protein